MQVTFGGGQQHKISGKGMSLQGKMDVSGGGFMDFEAALEMLGDDAFMEIDDESEVWPSPCHCPCPGPLQRQRIMRKRGTGGREA